MEVETPTRADAVLSDWRHAERARMLRTLKQLLKTARKEIKLETTTPELRLRWMNTIVYITQTLNSVLKDADYDQLKQEVEKIQRTVNQTGQR